jgi:class 3 adenylate cyclase
VFFMTDVVGSTALWESHGQVMPVVLARHDEGRFAQTARNGL